MRNFVLILILFIFIAAPAHAESRQEGFLIFIMTPVQYFVVNNSSPFTFTFDEYSDFGTAHDLGDVSYDLINNGGWQVDGRLLDGATGGQITGDWDDASWTLSVNGVTLVEGTSNIVDSDTGTVNRDDATWEVLLTIPWAESAGTADCQIQLTAQTA